MGLGAGGIWQICCVCSDQPCLSSKVHTRNVLTLLFLVADSAFTVRLFPSSSSCCAELSLAAGLDSLVLTDRQKLSKGRPTLLKPHCFCRLGSEPGLALSAPSILPEKNHKIRCIQKLSFCELVLSLAFFLLFLPPVSELSQGFCRSDHQNLDHTNCQRGSVCVMLHLHPWLLSTALSRAAEGAQGLVPPLKLSARLSPLICISVGFYPSSQQANSTSLFYRAQLEELAPAASLLAPSLHQERKAGAVAGV